MEDDQHCQNPSEPVPLSEAEAADVAGEPPMRPVHMKRSAKRTPASPGAVKTIPITSIWLAGQSPLFEAGRPDDASDDEHYLRRLNTVLATRMFRPGQRYPKAVAAAIDGRGRAAPHAELPVFGRWLLINGKPGAKRSPGRQADPKVVLRTLAAALSVLRRHEQNAATAGTDPAGKPLRITATGLAGEWNRMFEDAASASDFPARLRSLRRVLDDFDIQLKAGAITGGGKPVRSTPQIAAVAAAIASGVARPAVSPSCASSAPSTASAGRAAGTTSAATAPGARLAPAVVPDAFEIVLRYASQWQEQVYRDRAPGALPVTTISYFVEPLRPSAEGRTVLKGREHHLVLRPRINLRRDYRIRALVDRMAILVTTRVKADRKALQRLLAGQTGVICYVVDRTSVGAKRSDWRAQLPEPDSSIETGHHFAILIQEPEPALLRDILAAIDTGYRIEGAVKSFLVELSVDFRPRKDASPDEQIRLREQMAGLLQRHHWSRQSALVDDPEVLLGGIDARQVYREGADKPKTRYLFTRRAGTRHLSDADLEQPDVRARLLQTNTAHDLFLNATLYKGTHSGGAQVSIQHKMTDRVDPEKGTMQVLPVAERRARVEVCFSGKQRMSALGLEKVQDLSRLKFRDLRKDVIMFRVGTATAGEIQGAIEEMQYRGVYGLELAMRARQIKERHQKTARRRRDIKRSEHEGAGLVDWQEMNEAVGDALDALTKRWRRFSWP